MKNPAALLSDAKQERWPTIRRYAVVWTTVGLVASGQAIFLWPPATPLPVSRTTLVLWQIAIWYGWGMLTPVILWLGQRFSLDRRNWGRKVLLLAVAGAVVALTHLAYFTWTWRLVLPEQVGRLPFLAVLRQAAHQQFDFEWFIYWAVLGSGYFLDYYQRYRERELRAAQLERQLAEAQLQALKMQLHPHFLFNTLNTIATQVRKQDHEAALRMVVGLSELLRYALAQADQQEVPLRQELDFIEQYLEIEQARFRDRLTVRMQIPPETLDAVVPNLILQPLVENAVRHGIAQRAAAGMIEISAWRTADTLHLQVRDDGPGLRETAQETAGIGLSNTRARLQRLYGEASKLALHNRDGVTITLTIPFHTASLTA